MSRANHSCYGVAMTLLALGLVTPAWRSLAQPVVGGQRFKFAEYYDPPHETQMKSLLEGARAQRQPDGRILGTDVKYRTFQVTGEGEMIVEAPQGLYDATQQSISSAGPLHVQTADNRFSIDGVGFLFQKTNSFLWVSNRVHTIIHPELLSQPLANATTNVAVEQAPGTAEQAPGINIFSDQFEYAENSGLGVYQGNVRVTGTNLISTAGKLTILMPQAERRLQTITAEKDVIIDYEKIHATGGKALYSADTGLIQLTNQPTWRIEQRDGSGDELVFDRTNKIFRAIGHARLKIPAQSMGTSGFLAGPGSVSSNALPSTNHFVEVLCDNYELRTNLAVFRQTVRASDRLGDHLQGEMSCDLMTLTLAGTNELQKLVAEHQVVIGQEDKQFMAEHAEYTGTNGVLDLTGNPAWRAGTREGQGDLLRVNLAREEMLVHGNAVMRLPAAELGQSEVSGLGKSQRSEAKAATKQFAVIHSQEYFLTPDSALFRGGVSIEHPQLRWTSDEITMLTPPELGKTGHMMIGEPAVVFDIVDDQGQNFHGTGDKAVYTHRTTATRTNDLMVLTGNPAVLQATNLVGRNNVFTLDLTSHKLMASGKYALWGAAPALATTTLQPSKSRSRK